MYKIAFLISHPIQYQAPLFKNLSNHPEIDLTVYFNLRWGLMEYKSPEFGKEIKWDIPLLEGYKYKFLKNYSPRPKNSFFGQINFGIVKELYRNRYDAVIVHGWNSFTNILAIFTAKIFGIKVILRGESPLNQELLKPQWKLVLRKVFLRIFFKLVDAFLYIGKENKAFYKFYGVKEEKLFFAPYAVDNERFIKIYRKLIKDRDKIRRSFGFGKETIVILFVGKLIEKKRPFDLLKAYKELNIKNKALIFVGDGKLREEMEKFVKENNVENIIFAGFVNQSKIPKYYLIADIFVLPSGSGETWGLVINEAMCFGLPIVVSDLVGSAKDLVRDGENGYIFPFGDYKELAEYINSLAKNKKERKKMGEKSFEIVSQIYNFEKDIEAILNALAKLGILRR